MNDSKVWPKVKLHPHQRKAQANVIKAWRSKDRNKWRSIIVMPTGAGKTMACSAILELYDYFVGGGRHLILVQSKNLLYQTASHFRHVNPSLMPVSIIGDGHRQYRGKVVVTTVQSAARLNVLGKLARVGFDTVTIDECHHGVTAQHLLVYKAVRACNPHVRLLGLTATPIRFDERGLAEIFHHVACVVQFRYLLRRKLIAKPRYIRLPDASIETAYKAWRYYASDRRTIVYCDTIEEAQEGYTYFKERGVNAGLVLGDTPYTLRCWREENNQVIFNCGVYIEGRDAPGISCILLLNRPWRWRYVQMVGRGLRPDTQDCIVIGTRHYNILANLRTQDVLGTAQPLPTRARRPSWWFRLKSWATAVVIGETSMSSNIAEFAHLGRGWVVDKMEKLTPEELVEEILDAVIKAEEATKVKPTAIVIHCSTKRWAEIEEGVEDLGLKRYESGNLVPIVNAKGMNLWVGVPKPVPPTGSNSTKKSKMPEPPKVEEDPDEDEVPDNWDLIESRDGWKVKIKEVVVGEAVHMAIVFAKQPKVAYVYQDISAEDIIALRDGDNPGEYYNSLIKGCYYAELGDYDDLDNYLAALAYKAEPV